MTLEQLKIFLKIAELESFSKAARAIYLSQPSVSTHISALERELGTKLFDRHGKRITLTKPGTILLKYSKEITEIEREAKSAIDIAMGIKRGEIRLGSSNIPGSYLLTPFIQKCGQEHPQIKIISTIGDTCFIANELIIGKLDIGVVGNKTHEGQLDYFDFVQDTLCLAVNAKNPVAAQEAITLEELQTLPFLVREEGSGSRKAMRDILYQNGLSLDNLNIITQLGNTEAIKHGIKKGFGVSILSIYAIQDEIKAGTIKAIKVKHIEFTRYFYIIVNKSGYSLPIVHFFKEFLLLNRKDLINPQNIV